MKKISLIVMILIVAIPVQLHATGDDLTIDANARKMLLDVTSQFIKDRQVSGHYLFYDAVTDDLLRLTFKRLHAGIRSTKSYYLTCSTFVDSEGHPYDLDFMVVKKKDQQYTVLQGFVHGVDGQKRPHHPPGF